MSLHLDVIHTVGPMDEHPGALTRCYKNVLEIMKEKELKSVVMIRDAKVAVGRKGRGCSH